MMNKRVMLWLCLGLVGGFAWAQENPAAESPPADAANETIKADNEADGDGEAQPLTLLPPFHVDRLLVIPDMTQTDPRAELPGGGRQYCGPVAVSNTLMWLAEQGGGLSALKPDAPAPLNAHYELARTLGSISYMGTSVANGTGVHALATGLAKYLDDRGVTDYTISYQGWRPAPRNTNTHVRNPSRAFIHRSLEGLGGAWLNIGWYKLDPQQNTYQRTGGHWVTLVGYGVTREGDTSPDMVTIHDPAPRAGQPMQRQFVRLIPLTDGQLIGNQTGLPRPAAGLFRAAGEMTIHPRVDVAILDGVVALRLRSDAALTEPTDN